MPGAWQWSYRFLLNVNAGTAVNGLVDCHHPEACLPATTSSQRLCICWINFEGPCTHAAHALQVALTLFPFVASEAAYLEATARKGAKRHLNCLRCLLLPACQFDLALGVILDPAWHCGQWTLTAATALHGRNAACILINAGLYECKHVMRGA